jgi:hypothetical protein
MGEFIDNKWANFFFQIVLGASGAKEMDFENVMHCLPYEWVNSDDKHMDVEYAITEPKKIWTKILDGIQYLISFVCHWKTNIINLFARRTRRQQRRKKYRMLVQTNSSRMARYRRALGWWEDIKAYAKKILDKVKSWVEAVWADIKDFALEFIHNIKLFWIHFIQTLYSYLNSDFIAKITDVMKCMKKSYGMVQSIIDVISGIITRVTEIASIVAGNFLAIFKIFIDLMCNFEVFRTAINYLIDGIEAENTNVKYRHFGRFVGTLIKALTTKKLRRFRLKH